MILGSQPHLPHAGISSQSYRDDDNSDLCFHLVEGYSSSPLEVGGPKGVGTVYHEKICSHVSPGRMLGTCVFFMVTEVLRVFS